ncbi:MAG: hypothetical protein PHY73_03850 [Candidatus Omnitrophica bacterium]|nr:hypothetical protein [Candidatus Omnitrophota bacterium]
MEDYKRANKKFLGELLIERGVINKTQLDEAILYQSKKGVLIGEALILLKHASEEDIAQALTSQYGFPYLPLSNYEIEEDVLSSVPLHLCEKFCLVPIDKIGASLTLAMANPLVSEAIEEIEELTKCSVQTFVSTSTDVRNTIDRYYRAKK